MKKIVLLFACALLYVSGTAQYEQGDIDISLGTGIGVYGASVNDGSVDSSSVDAASGLFNLNANYAVIEKLSVGLNIERNSFITPNDSSNTDTYGTSFNYKFVTQFRFVNSEKNCIALRAGVGMSYFKFGDRVTNDYVKGNGLNYDFALEFEHYFGEHVGMFFNGGYSSYNYKKLLDQDGEVWLTNGNAENTVFKLAGVNLRIGLQFKI